MDPLIPSPIAREYLAQGRSTSCPIIDVHGHMGPYHSIYLPWSSAEQMRHSMELCGVTRIVCSHHTALAYDMERGNARMQEAVDAYPDQFLGYWLINPNYPDIIEKDLHNFDQTRGFVGFKLWADYHHVPVTSPKYAPALEYADEHGLVQMVHTWGDSPFDAPGLVAELAERYPRAQFLMAHSGHGDFETAVSLARDMPNLYLDLTSVPNPHDFSMMAEGSLMLQATLSTPSVGGIIEYMVGTAGSKKVVFGSDSPWYSQHYHAGAVLFARISDEARHDILHRNAERLLAGHLG
jgi:predicted TIM-barrel fold metal-dependent hydrolase